MYNLEIIACACDGGGWCRCILFTLVRRSSYIYEDVLVKLGGSYIKQCIFRRYLSLALSIYHSLSFRMLKDRNQ